MAFRVNINVKKSQNQFVQDFIKEHNGKILHQFDWNDDLKSMVIKFKKEETCWDLIFQKMNRE